MPKSGGYNSIPHALHGRRRKDILGGHQIGAHWRGAPHRHRVAARLASWPPMLGILIAIWGAAELLPHAPPARVTRLIVAGAILR